MFPWTQPSRHARFHVIHLVIKTPLQSIACVIAHRVISLAFVSKRKNKQSFLLYFRHALNTHQPQVPSHLASVATLQLPYFSTVDIEQKCLKGVIFSQGYFFSSDSTTLNTLHTSHNAYLFFCSHLFVSFFCFLCEHYSKRCCLDGAHQQQQSPLIFFTIICSHADGSLQRARQRSLWAWRVASPRSGANTRRWPPLRQEQAARAGVALFRQWSQQF